MKLSFFVLLSFFGLFIILFSGCYTQLRVVRDERESDQEYTSGAPQEADSLYENEGDSEGYGGRSDYYNNYDDQWHHPMVGFSYYYPSYYWPSAAFSYAYADPWFYDYYWGYSPWICGTPYLGYGWNYPYYSSYYPYWWGGYGYGGGRVNRGSREFGNTRGTAGRGAADTRINVPSTERGNASLPTGARLGRTPNGAGTGRNAPAVKDNSRRTSNVRSYAPRDAGRSTSRSGVVGQGSRGTSKRSDGARRSQGQQRVPMYNPAPPSHNSVPRGGSTRHDPGVRSQGGTRGSSPSYAPPPARMPSSPPPSSGSGGQPGGGSRGSGSRRP